MARSVHCGVLVTVDIVEAKVPEFLNVMRIDALGSRAEPGCLRFDLLRDRDRPNRYCFYEGYASQEAIQAHKETPHYCQWASFRAAGVDVSAPDQRQTFRFESVSIPGGWAWQADDAPHGRAGAAVVITVEISPDRVDAFLVAMEADVKGSRDPKLDAGCLRFDLVRSIETPNRFIFYEAYTDDAAAANHKTTEHYKAWAKFKAEGGVLSQTVARLDGVATPWAFQAASATAGTLSLPLVGFGTYKVGVVPGSAASAVAFPLDPSAGGQAAVHQTVCQALSCGYRLLDCAQFYTNERWVGEAIAKASLPRDQLTIVSKVWNDVIYAGADAVKAQVEKSVKELGCGHLDLVLVHWPVPGKHVAAYNALRECKRSGLVREIGVSNFCVEDYEELRAAGCFGPDGNDKPAVNQIEVNPSLFRRKTIRFFRDEGVHVQAYRGLMQGAASWDASPELQAVCKEVGRPPAQVLGRFLVQQGISHVPKASSAPRMMENRDVFTFALSTAQIERLAATTTPDNLRKFQELYAKCIWRDTPKAGTGAVPARTIE